MSSPTLRTLRQAAGMTQAQVAAHLGVSRSAVALYENGVNRVPATRLQSLATLLRVPLETLYTSCYVLPRCPPQPEEGP